MINRDDVNIDASPELIPLQSGTQEASLVPAFQAAAGQLRSLAGMLGPDILIAVGAASNGFVLTAVAGANIETFSLTAPNTLRLLASTSLNLNSILRQTLYTVPAGKTAVIAFLVFRSPSVDITAVAQQLSFGFNVLATDWNIGLLFPTATSGLTAATKYTVFFQDYAVGYSNSSVLGAAAGTFGAVCDVAFGSAAAVIVDVFGYEY